jgi:hypothetical protein
VKYVLDTNIVSHLLKGDERVLSYLADVEPSDVGIPLLCLPSCFSAPRSRFASSRCTKPILRARAGAPRALLSREV